MPEVAMMAKWYGHQDLVHSDEFWDDCMAMYLDKTVPLPVTDEPVARARVADLVQCPPGACGTCCGHYDRIAMTHDELRALKALSHAEVRSERDEEGKLYLTTRGGCQFLKNNICTVYSARPETCRAFPLISPRDGVTADGVAFQQLRMKVGCPAALAAIRTVLTELCASGKFLLLPDLSLIPRYEENRGFYAGVGLTAQGEKQQALKN